MKTTIKIAEDNGVVVVDNGHITGTEIKRRLSVSCMPD